MRKILLTLALLSPLALLGCGDDDDGDCNKFGDSQGCTSDFPWSCSEADNCYDSRSGCESSGECD